MALTKLVFTKLWTSSTDFPTIEDSEAQVRADIQLLHDETKTALNAVIDELEGAGASDIGATATGRTSTNVQGIITEINTDVTANTTARHTHSNKALLDTYTQTEANLADAVTKKHNHDNKLVLDAITATVKGYYDRIVTVLTGVTRVSTTLTALDTDIPTCKAVTDAMSTAGNGDMMKAAYATESSTKVDCALNADALGGLSATDYALADDLEEVEAALDTKADLGIDGKVPANQLPSLNYIPMPESAVNGNVLTYSSADSAWVAGSIPGTYLQLVWNMGTTAPTNTKLLWIDTTPVTGGLKYYNGSAWVHVPVSFT